MFLIVFSSVLLSTISSGIVVYLWTNSTNEEAIGKNFYYKADHPNGEMRDDTPFVMYKINNGEYVIQIEVRGEYPIDQQQR